ncbi:MAG: hypothetical protein V3V37_08720 [Candidatus Adiutricales bacterium]
MSDDTNALINPPDGEITPTTEPVETQPPVSMGEPVVDTEPDPEPLRSEIEGLEARKAQLQKDMEKEKENLIAFRKQRNREGFEARTGKADEIIPAAPAAAPDTGVLPKQEDFEDYEQYNSALIDYKVKQARVGWEAEATRKAAQGDSDTRQENLYAKLDEGVERFEDFTEVVFDQTAVQITPMIVDLLTDCEDPAGVAYYLAKNRVEGVKISRMTPTQAARSMLQIEQGLAANPEPLLETKKHSTAPEPIKPVGSTSKVTKDPKKMTQKEYNAYRESQGARRF